VSIGDTFAGKYRIVGELGRGGRGVVYKAEDTQLERNVALKFLPSELKIYEEACKRFVLEAKSAASLSHPNICTIYEINEEKAHSFIAMEYVEGKSLKEWLKEGPPGLDDVVDIGIQVAEGLDEAHQKGIIHRDIKSANIMLTERGQAKIMDFGLAKVAGGLQITQEARTMGTIAYMSPEQTTGEDVDHRTDIWSLGVVLYELACGVLPFRGDRDEAILFSIRNDEPKPIAAIDLNVPHAFEQIVQKCLAKDPKNRYQSADELVQDLRSLRRDTKSLIVKPKSVIARVGHRTIKIRFSWIFAGLATLFVLAAAYFLVFHIFPDKSLTEPRLPLVAVAPFENQTGDVSLDRIGVEITELIESGLFQSGLVAVLENRVLVRSDENDSLNSLAKSKGVMKLISGAYFLEGENIRFTSKLIDTQKSEVELAVDPVSGTIEAPFHAMQLIYQNILGGLASTLDSNFANRLGKEVSTSYDAWKEFMAAKDAEARYDWIKVRDHYHKAWELDPSFFFARYREGKLYFAPYVPRQLRDSEKAEVIFRELNESRDSLDPLSRARLDWGLARIKHDWEWCYQAAKEAIRYSPTDQTSLVTSALRTNRPREALEFLKRPDTKANTPGQEWQDVMRWVVTYHKLGKHKKALKEAQKGRELYPDRRQVLNFEIECLAILGRTQEMNKRWDLYKDKRQMAFDQVEISRLLTFYDHEEASQELGLRALDWYQNQPVPDDEPQRMAFRYYIAKALFRAGKLGEAEKAFSSFASDYPEEIVAQVYLGYIAAQRGERDKAMQMSEAIEKSGLHVRQKSFFRANIACQLGDFEEASELLRIAQKNGNDQLYLWETYGNVLLKPMLDYPPFKKFIEPKG